MKYFNYIKRYGGPTKQILQGKMLGTCVKGKQKKKMGVKTSLEASTSMASMPPRPDASHKTEIFTRKLSTYNSACASQ